VNSKGFFDVTHHEKMVVILSMLAQYSLVK
jgi:hypothetical protein